MNNLILVPAGDRNKWSSFYADYFHHVYFHGKRVSQFKNEVEDFSSQELKQIKEDAEAARQKLKQYILKLERVINCIK